MRGNFDNSEENLASLGPTRWSTNDTAHRIARGLQVWTAKRWSVTLKMNGPVPGGFYVAPSAGRIRAEDWQDLVNLFGVIPVPKAHRYYILPDEVTHVLSILEKSGPRPVRRSRKIDQIEDELRDEVG